MMRALLLAIGLGLVAALQAQEFPAVGQPLQDLLGRWYLKAMTSDPEIPGKKPESVTPLILKALEGGDLEAQITFLIDGQCQDVTLVLKKTNQPFTFTAYDGKRVVYILPSKVKDHYILYCEGELDGQEVRMAKLVGRDPENNPEALEEFKEVARAKGLNLDIVRPQQSGRKDTCFPGGVGVQLELQLPAYATATAMPDPSHICNLHHSSRQCQILNPLSEARDRTHVLLDTG
uniref:Odorant binding protein 2B n=1 Tax=Sus scrofa TaxID=9823 RepID=A0A8D0PDY6_PIG